MTTYDPTPVVTIDGLDSTTINNAVDVNISINYGRANILEQSQPAYAKLDVYMDKTVALDIAIGQSVTIGLNKSTSGTQTIFVGVISDLDAELYANGAEGGIVRYSLTALGPLAQLHRFEAGAAGYAKEFDGTRILNILSDAFLTSWDDVSPTLTWEAVPETTTWDTYDGSNIALVDSLSTTVDSPGDYELMDYTAGATDALELAHVAAKSGMGLLWGSGDGKIYYYSASHRASLSPLTLTADDMLSASMQFSSGIGEIVNDVTVTYRAGSEYARDEQSAILYGQLSGTRETELHNQSDAATQATIFAQTRAFPRTYPEKLTFELTTPEMSNATRDALLAVGADTRLQTDALPPAFGTSFDGFVENWSWNLSRNSVRLQVGCSTYSENYPELTWLQVSPTYTWDSYGVANPTTKWSDL